MTARRSLGDEPARLTLRPRPRRRAGREHARRRPASASPATGDFSGLVDIGGRSLYLECRGSGSPTVILESGAGGRADVWSRDLSRPARGADDGPTGVAAFTRVCSYDRPEPSARSTPPSTRAGLISTPAEAIRCPSRVRRGHHDRSARSADPAQIPGPYVLVGHSAGGLSQRLYASTYPDDVVGMVLIDSTHENIYRDFSTALPPEVWAAFEASNNDQTELQAAYPAAEQCSPCRLLTP